MKVKSLSRVQLFATPWTAAYQAPAPMGFSRQEYWSGLPLPSPAFGSATTKSLQSCPTLCDPIDGSPSSSSVHGIFQARVLEWVAIAFSKKNIYFCFIDCAKAFDCVYHNKLCKILKEMGIPDRLTCLLRNLCAGQEATVRTRHGATDWFQIGEGVHQGCISLH